MYSKYISKVALISPLSEMLYSTFKNVFKMKLEIDKEIALTNDTLDSHNLKWTKLFNK